MKEAGERGLAESRRAGSDETQGSRTSVWRRRPRAASPRWPTAQLPGQWSFRAIIRGWRSAIPPFPPPVARKIVRWPSALLRTARSWRRPQLELRRDDRSHTDFTPGNPLDRQHGCAHVSSRAHPGRKAAQLPAACAGQPQMRDVAAGVTRFVEVGPGDVLSGICAALTAVPGRGDGEFAGECKVLQRVIT